MPTHTLISKPKPTIKKPAPPPPAKKQTMSAKQFTIAAWTGAGEGEKVIVYGESGIGKTSLCRLLSNAAFIGVDDGGRKIRKLDGTPLDRVPNIECFEDVRAALQSNVFESVDNIIVDNVSELERWALSATFRRIKIGQGKTADNIEDYGYHKGYRHWHDTMLLILSDCDRWIRKGKNVILVAQSTTVRIANPAGEDFLKQAPELHHDSSVSTLNPYIEWADHVFRIGYSHIAVTDGKAGSTNERAIFVHPEIHFYAKSRTIPAEFSVVEFKSAKDDSIWRLLFNENNSVNTG